MEKECLEFINKLIDRHELPADTELCVYFNARGEIVAFKGVNLAFGRVKYGVDTDRLSEYEYKQMSALDFVMLLNKKLLWFLLFVF